ncbi:MAG: hypothetical protein ACI9SC_000052 [Gammaproteobacteria bacterium]|jgi:hypothetical protein
MYRISITYATTPGASFNWEYYMNNHLPLAVGTSMRHSGLNFCDADKAVNDEAPHVCVCMVHFDSEDSMINFCNFFVKAHPESEKIDNDEKNYTTIPPNMVAGECERFDLAAVGDACYRVKLFFPFEHNLAASRENITEALKKLLDDLDALNAGVIATELDHCISGIVPGSDPDNSLIWALCFNKRQDAERFTEVLRTSENLQCLKELMHNEPEIMISEVMPFDMTLTEPYRNL